MHKHTHWYTHTHCMYTHTHWYTHTYVCTCRYTHTHTHTHSYTLSCTCVCTNNTHSTTEQHTHNYYSTLSKQNSTTRQHHGKSLNNQQTICFHIKFTRWHCQLDNLKEMLSGITVTTYHQLLQSFWYKLECTDLAYITRKAKQFCVSGCNTELDFRLAGPCVMCICLYTCMEGLK